MRIPTILYFYSAFFFLLDNACYIINISPLRHLRNSEKEKEENSIQNPTSQKTKSGYLFIHTFLSAFLNFKKYKIFYFKNFCLHCLSLSHAIPSPSSLSLPVQDSVHQPNWEPCRTNFHRGIPRNKRGEAEDPHRSVSTRYSPAVVRTGLAFSRVWMHSAYRGAGRTQLTFLSPGRASQAPPSDGMSAHAWHLGTPPGLSQSQPLLYVAATHVCAGPEATGAEWRGGAGVASLGGGPRAGAGHTPVPPEGPEHLSSEFWKPWPRNKTGLIHLSTNFPFSPHCQPSPPVLRPATHLLTTQAVASGLLHRLASFTSRFISASIRSAWALLGKWHQPSPTPGAVLSFPKVTPGFEPQSSHWFSHSARMCQRSALEVERTLSLECSQPRGVGGFLNSALQHPAGRAKMSWARESSSHLSHPKPSANSAPSQISPWGSRDCSK